MLKQPGFHHVEICFVMNINLCIKNVLTFETQVLVQDKIDMIEKNKADDKHEQRNGKLCHNQYFFDAE